MSATRAPQHRSLVRALAALLLLVEGGASASVGLLHASERVTAPAAIEAEHGTACVVLHDAARCPACQVAGVAALPDVCRSPVGAPARGERAPDPAREVRPARALTRATAPRAPPIPSV